MPTFNPQPTPQSTSSEQKKSNAPKIKKSKLFPITITILIALLVFFGGYVGYNVFYKKTIKYPRDRSCNPHSLSGLDCEGYCDISQKEWDKRMSKVNCDKTKGLDCYIEQTKAGIPSGNFGICNERTKKCICGYGM